MSSKAIPTRSRVSWRWTAWFVLPMMVSGAFVTLRWSEVGSPRNLGEVFELVVSAAIVRAITAIVIRVLVVLAGRDNGRDPT